MTETYDLDRFVRAQDASGTYKHALQELRNGRKTSHWMWFVFPQIAGLGQSSISREFAISSLEEAQQYSAHPILGQRIVMCANTLLTLETNDPVSVCGSIDAQKLRSSMTLFARAVPEEPAFVEVLDRFFGGQFDERTDEILQF